MPTFYYATQANGNNWSLPGKTHPEPVRVEGAAPLGKEPVFCCETLALAVKARTVMGRDGHDGLPPTLLGAYMTILHCPACGEEVRWEHDLTLRVVETTRVITENHYEVAEAAPAK